MRRWLYFVMSSVALGSMGSWAFSEAGCTRDRSEVALMTEKMKTVCVGRYLILSLQAQAGINVRPGSPPAGSSLHEDAVLVLRDRIAASIRLRNPDTTSPRAYPRPADPWPPVVP